MAMRCVIVLAALMLCTYPADASSYDSDFGRFGTSGVYTGKPKLPDFNGRDKTYRSFRTRLINGAKGGANFAGKYAIVDMGCGTGCHSPFMIDVSTGQVLSFPLGGEDNMYLSMKYRPDSRLLIAQWQEDDESCVQEAMIWTGTEFKRSGAKKVDAGYGCSNPI